MPPDTLLPGRLPMAATFPDNRSGIVAASVAGPEGVFESAPVPLILLSSVLRALRVNRAFEELGLNLPFLTMPAGLGDLLGCVHAAETPWGCGATSHCRACRLRAQLTTTADSGQTLAGIELVIAHSQIAPRPATRFHVATLLLDRAPGPGILVALAPLTHAAA